MPKTTPEEKKLREDAVQKAFRQAAEIPLDTARTCLEALEIGRSICGKINKHAASDLAVGALSVHTGAIGALLNTAINLPYISDKNLASALDGQVHLLRASVDELIADIRAAVYEDSIFAVFRP
jgi:formiminotetrahydrofolate cyclodeaminase